MAPKKAYQPILVSLQKIWDTAPHNALTDLIFYNDRWYCVFRESDAHVFGKNGVIRLLTSENAITWTPLAVIEDEGFDLRDPKLSITPNGKLMLLVGASRFTSDKKRIYHQSLVSFSDDGTNWGHFYPVLDQHEWLWRVTWYQGVAYGVSYRFSDPGDRKQEWVASLWKSEDGMHYDIITEFQIPGQPNETTLRFHHSGQMIALMRREFKHDDHAWIGTSFPPYEDWLWAETKNYFGGPNFVINEDGTMWASGRMVYKTAYGTFERSVLAVMTLKDLFPVLILPSGGDTSYPGMVLHDGHLWISYYSSHEKNTAIYLAKIDLG